MSGRLGARQLQGHQTALLELCRCTTGLQRSKPGTSVLSVVGQAGELQGASVLHTQVKQLSASHLTRQVEGLRMRGRTSDRLRSGAWWLEGASRRAGLSLDCVWNGLACGGALLNNIGDCR